ncbi:MAG: 23S rRNA (guanosine(2251)-2'-O)-methyltransferase RlmB [Pyrinomonadaceae bacterium]
MKRPETNQRGSHEKRQQKETNANIVVGVFPVLEALRANARRIDKLLIADGAMEHRLRDIVAMAKERGILIDRVRREKIESFVGREINHQGVVAYVAAADYSDAEDILESVGDDALLLLLDGVEDPRNFGAILRTAECSGVDGVFIPERRAVGLNETVAKSAAGATEFVKVAKVTNINRLIEDLKSRNIWVVGTSVDAEMDHTEWDWTRASALVLGGEGKGIHRLVAENCDVLVKIPMYGKIDSLNVSVAAGVLLFEVRRQRTVSRE